MCLCRSKRQEQNHHPRPLGHAALEAPQGGASGTAVEAGPHVGGQRACVHHRDRAAPGYSHHQRAFKPIVASIGCRKPASMTSGTPTPWLLSVPGTILKRCKATWATPPPPFTLDVYGHVTDQMKQESARRMDSYIKDVLGQ